jgi:hypothetical protein
MEFNNNWGGSVYNESSYIELQDASNNRMEAMSPIHLSFNDEIEEGELVVNENVEHKNVV